MLLCVPDALLLTNLSCPVAYELNIVPTQYLISHPPTERSVAENATFALTSMVVLLHLSVFDGMGGLAQRWSEFFVFDAVQKHKHRFFSFTALRRRANESSSRAFAECIRGSGIQKSPDVMQPSFLSRLRSSKLTSVPALETNA